MMVWLPILFPVLGAAGALLSRRRPALAAGSTVAALVAALVAAVAAAATGAAATGRWGSALTLGLAVEGPVAIMVVLVPLVAVPVVMFAGASHRQDPGLPRLLALLSVFVAAMELAVLAADFLTLLVGWELVGAFSWALIGHEWRDPDRPRSAGEAFVTTRAGDVGLFVAAGAAFAGTGSLRFADLAGADPRWLAVAAGGVVVAAAAKSAQVPFSPWLFSAMAGPTPVSALLHSATMVAAGAFLLARLQPALSAVPWFSGVVVGIGLLTALAGGLVALAQTDLKMALAGSTSAQHGLILVAIGAGYTAAGMGHLAAHALFKALLFLGAGVALHAAGTLDLNRLRLGSALPRVAALFGLGTAALAAVPPLGASFTKEAVLAAAVEAGTWTGAGTLAAGLLSALYAARLQLLTFGPGPAAAGRPDRVEGAALGMLAAGGVGLGVLWLPAGSQFLASVSGGNLAEAPPRLVGASLATVGLGIALAVAARRRGRLVDLGLPTRVRLFVAGWWGLASAARGIVVDPTLRASRHLDRVDRLGIEGLVGGLAAGVIALSRSLSRGAERTIDGAVRALAGAVAVVSASARRAAERTIDGIVEGIAAFTLSGADVSGGFDDTALDGAVEAVAGGIGYAGREGRRAQTGMSHHYYTILAAGSLVIFVVAAIWR